MKFFALFFIAISLLSVGCKKTKKAPPETVQPTNKVYGEKAFAGRDRVKLIWKASGEISKYRISWNAEKNLEEIPSVTGKTDYELIIKDLPEQNHVFFIAAFDNNGNASERVKIQCESYGTVYEGALTHRRIKKIVSDASKNTILISWEEAQKNELSTALTFKDKNAVQQTQNISPSSESSEIANINAGADILIRTAYLPEPDAIDTFYSAYDTIRADADTPEEEGYNFVSLNADGPGNTYELLGEVLGGNPEETPDCAHPSFGRHIAEEFDAQLNENVFAFFAHVTPDNDRCGATDRQRTEIKTYGSSPNTVKALRGDEMIFKWKFKLASGFQPSSSFTHIHQIKAGDGSNAGSPLMTITPRYGSSGDKLEIIHTGDNSASGQGKVTGISLEPLKGIWVEVVEKIKFDTHGTYELTLKKVSDGAELLHYTNSDIDFWRSGATFIRPKWGIYRSLNNAERLRDEKVLFADFKIGKK